MPHYPIMDSAQYAITVHGAFGFISGSESVRYMYTVSRTNTVSALHTGSGASVIGLLQQPNNNTATKYFKIQSPDFQTSPFA